MVATRSSGRDSQADTPQKHVTLSGKVNKPKKATKAKKKPGAAPMKAEDLVFEAELMKQVGLGEVSLHECHRRLQKPATATVKTYFVLLANI